MFKLTKLDFPLFLHILFCHLDWQVKLALCLHIFPKVHYLRFVILLLMNFGAQGDSLLFYALFLIGIPGLKASLLEEFGIRLVTYDLPGFGESDPQPNRNLESSALDMSYLASVVGINDKFWVVGYSGGSIHTWASLRYIPDRLAGNGPFIKKVCICHFRFHYLCLSISNI